jgi:hypothetical protein
VQFAKGDLMFLMNKRHTSGTIGGQGKHFIAGCGVVSSVASDMFHGFLLEMVFIRWRCRV